MSNRFVRRLERIRDEYQAASGALAYVSVSWYEASIFNFPGLETVGVEEVLRAANDLESTYFIRLFSLFEGILKEHMAESHPGIRVAEDASLTCSASAFTPCAATATPLCIPAAIFLPSCSSPRLWPA